MRKGSTAAADPGQYEVWLESPGKPAFLWLTGLVNVTDAEKLAEQANRAAVASGKVGRYVVKGATK